MKKTLIFILTVVFVLAVSCEKTTEPGVKVTNYPMTLSAVTTSGLVKGGTGMGAPTFTFSELDNAIIMVATDPAVTSTDVWAAAKVGTLTLAGGMGTFTTSLASLGVGAAGQNRYVGFEYKVDGNSANEACYVRNTSPFTVTPPTGVVQNTVAKDFTIAVKTASALITAVTTETKVTKNAAYPAAVPFTVPGTATTFSNKLTFTGATYNPGDTIYVRVNATTAVATKSIEKSFVVGVYTFPTTTAGVKFANDLTKAYNLVTKVFAATGTAENDNMIFASVPGTSIGWTAGITTEFVKSTLATYNANNQVAAIAEFTAGAKLANVADVKVDEVYIYKTMRGATAHYGMFKVTAKVENANPALDSFTIDIKSN